MKAVVFHGVGDIRLDDMPEPKILQPTDAIEAYKAFDTRQSGWVKVELLPGK
jgi:threonine dehydrogenase-like Zn-dependent dehydrogenase